MPEGYEATPEAGIRTVRDDKSGEETALPASCGRTHTKSPAGTELTINSYYLCVK